MSSYLSKLAARALEQPQPIRPRLASLFEPVDGTHVRGFETANTRRGRSPGNVTQSHDEEGARSSDNSSQITSPSIGPGTEVSGAVREASKKQIDDRPPIKWVSEPIIQPLAQSRALDAEGITERSIAEHSVAIESSIQTGKQPHETGANDEHRFIRDKPQPQIQIAPSIVLAETKGIETRSASSIEGTLKPDSGRVFSEAPRGRSMTIKPNVTTGHAQSLNIEAPAQEAPSSIRITIGRVDVRAIMPQPQPAAPARQSTASRSLSLDEYLKKRNGT